MNTNIVTSLDTRRLKKDGTFPVILRLSHNRKTIPISTGYSVLEKFWDAKNRQIKTSYKGISNVTRVNKILADQKSRALGVITELADKKELDFLAIKDLKEKILGKSKSQANATVVGFIDEQIADMLTAGKSGNAAVYKTLQNKLIAFYGNDSLTFSQIDYKFLKKMEAQHYAKGCDTGGLSVYMRTLRSIYNRAIKTGHVSQESYPFKNYSIKNKKPVRKALSIDEFEVFKKIDLSGYPHLIRSRNLYMASFYLRGMNWMDMAFLRWSNIERAGGDKRIVYVRQKTSEPFTIKIREPLEKILHDFEQNEEQTKKEDNPFLFPILQECNDPKCYALVIKNKRSNLNKYLRRIAQMAEIKPFSIYSARHTYATSLKRNSAPTGVIQEAMGHATETITQTYLDGFETSVIDSYDELL